MCTASRLTQAATAEWYVTLRSSQLYCSQVELTVAWVKAVNLPLTRVELWSCVCPRRATIMPVTTFLLVRSLLGGVQCGTWLKAEQLEI